MKERFDKLSESNCVDRNNNNFCAPKRKSESLTYATEVCDGKENVSRVGAAAYDG